MRAHAFRKLHGKGADAARRAVDEHVLARRDRPGRPQPLQRGGRRHRHGRRLHEAEAGRLRRERLRAGADVLSEPAEAAGGQVAIHRVARLKVCHAAADRDHTPGDVGAEGRALRPAQPRRQAERQRLAAQQVQVGLIE